MTASTPTPAASKKVKVYLTGKVLRAMRQDYISGIAIAELAKKYNVHDSTIYNRTKGRARQLRSNPPIATLRPAPSTVAHVPKAALENPSFLSRAAVNTEAMSIVDMRLRLSHIIDICTELRLALGALDVTNAAHAAR